MLSQRLYGCVLRLMECVRFRVKDIDLERNQIIVRHGKGMKDRVTMLPQQLRPLLLDQLEKVKTIHEQDLREGFGDVYLPYALERKYKNASKELGWQWVFPAGRISKDPRSGKMRRHHISESALQKAVRAAGRKAGLTKPVSPHTFRHYAEFRIMPSGT